MWGPEKGTRSASGWLWGQSHARHPEGSGHEPGSQGRTARRAPDGPGAPEDRQETMGDREMVKQVSGKGGGGRDTQGAEDTERFTHREKTEN